MDTMRALEQNAITNAKADFEQGISGVQNALGHPTKLSRCFVVSKFHVVCVRVIL